jgi:Arc/MetJ-type ribon-helix-helix transcriptional regulator
MELTLPPQLEEFVRSQVRSGRYADEQEVVREALRQMRSLVKAAEDPSITGLVRDALGLANQAQKDVMTALASAEEETTVLGEVSRTAAAVASGAIEVARKVPGAKEIERLVRGPVDSVAAVAEYGETQTKAVRQNLEASAKALGLLTAVLERVNGATRAVNTVVGPRPPAQGQPPE